MTTCLTNDFTRSQLEAVLADAESYGQGFINAARQLLATMQENERLRTALRKVIPVTERSKLAGNEYRQPWIVEINRIAKQALSNEVSDDKQSNRA